MKKFLAGTIGVLSTIAVAGGALAIHNKVSEKKITIKRGDAVWIGDETKKEEEPIVVKPSEEEISAMDKYCQDNHCMLINLICVSSGYVGSDLVKVTSVETMYDEMYSAGIIGDLPEFEIGLATSVDGDNFISTSEYETKLPAMFAEKYMELYIILPGQFDTVAFIVNNSEVQTSLYSEGKVLSFPEDPPAPEGYTFAGWATLNPSTAGAEALENLVDKTTYAPDDSTTLYAVYINGDNKVYRAQLVVTSYTSSNDVTTYPNGTTSESMDLSNSLISSENTIAVNGLTFVGWSNSATDLNNLREDLVFTMDDTMNIYAVYEDSQGVRHSYEEVSTLKVHNPLPTQSIKTYCYMSTDKTALIQALNDYSTGLDNFMGYMDPNTMSIVDLNSVDFSALSQGLLVRYNQ